MSPLVIGAIVGLVVSVLLVASGITSLYRGGGDRGQAMGLAFRLLIEAVLVGGALVLIIFAAINGGWGFVGGYLGVRALALVFEVAQSK